MIPVCRCRRSWRDRESWGSSRFRLQKEEEEGAVPEGVGTGVDDDEEDAEGINIFLRDASLTKGIHCRLGMNGVREDLLQT